MIRENYEAIGEELLQMLHASLIRMELYAEMVIR